MGPNEQTKRPKLLTWLCIVSATAGVLWIGMFLAVIVSTFSGNVPKSLFPGIVIEYFQAGYWFIVTEILLTAFGIIGIYLMWHMKKAGFYLYAISKSLIYFFPILIIGSNHFNFVSLFLTSVMIVLYGIVFSKRGYSY
jgi:hypothetical protein